MMRNGPAPGWIRSGTDDAFPSRSSLSSSPKMVGENGGASGSVTPAGITSSLASRAACSACAVLRPVLLAAFSSAAAVTTPSAP